MRFKRTMVCKIRGTSSYTGTMRVLIRPGTREGGQDKEWELFDCDKDPLELFNCYHEPEYAEVVREMTVKLENLMEEIGDEPCHPR